MTKPTTKIWIDDDKNKIYSYKLTRYVSIFLYVMYDEFVEVNLSIVQGHANELPSEFRIGRYSKLNIAKYKSIKLAKQHLNKLRNRLLEAEVAASRNGRVSCNH